MGVSEWLTLINVLVAFLGVCFVGFAIFEWHQLRALRKNMEDLEARVRCQMHSTLKATHRVLASYQVSDPQQRIALLESAAAAEPDAYNVWNALGYAYLDCKDINKAIDAFSQAVFRHPEDKAGYCDLAYAHTQNNAQDLALKYLRKAVAADPSARADIEADPRLRSFAGKL